MDFSCPYCDQSTPHTIEKQCQRCMITLPHASFARNASQKDGLQAWCKPCRKAWYQAHKPQVIAKEMERYHEWQTWRKDDPEVDAYFRKLSREKSARARARNPEKAQAAMKRWVAANNDTINAGRRRRYAANPQTILERNRRREYLRKGSAESTLTDAQFEAIKAAYNYRCVYCPPDCKDCLRKKHQLTRDHLTPVSRGGRDTIDNVVPACRSCNGRKQDGEVLKPVQPLLLL